MEEWKNGRDGRVEEWKVEGWKDGRMEDQAENTFLA